MLFNPTSQINKVWGQTKQSIIDMNLWHSKVSTMEVDKTTTLHAIMIYTKDYSDIPDVIRVLDYIETTILTDKKITIKYKTDEQTRDEIYPEGKEQPWFYNSFKNAHKEIKNNLYSSLGCRGPRK
jgi:hypothetical protein